MSPARAVSNLLYSARFIFGLRRSRGGAEKKETQTCAAFSAAPREISPVFSRPGYSLSATISKARFPLVSASSAGQTVEYCPESQCILLLRLKAFFKPDERNFKRIQAKDPEEAFFKHPLMICPTLIDSSLKASPDGFCTYLRQRASQSLIGSIFN